MVAVNLALWKTGRLETDLFHTRNRAPKALCCLPQGFRDSFDDVEVYLHLGMVNSAQRNAYDAMEASPISEKCPVLQAPCTNKHH